MERHSPVPRVEIDLPTGFLRLFSTLLAYGITVEVPAGITLYELLIRSLGIDATYLESSIQTVLHDGKPVDNLFDYRVHASSTIALSAALPGLFGAAFRKGGTFSPLRQKAANSSEIQGSTDQPIEIKIKLFNMVAAELGPKLLQRGIRLTTVDFLNFMAHYPERAGSITVRLDDDAVTPKTLAVRLASGGQHIWLFVKES